MLVLARKPDDGQNIIRIGPNITITVVHVKGKQVTVGVDAPKDVRILRGELPEKSLDESGGAGVVS